MSKGPGAPLATKTRGTPIVDVFENDGDTLLALSEIRRQRSGKSATVLEVQYYVSRSYQAGVSVYHVKARGDGVTLTVRILSWVDELDTVIGGVARAVAEDAMVAEVKREWRDAAAYLASSKP